MKRQWKLGSATGPLERGLGQGRGDRGERKGTAAGHGKESLSRQRGEGGVDSARAGPSDRPQPNPAPPAAA